MLYSIDTGKYVSSLPHKRDFDRWKSHISDADYQKVVDVINEKIDEKDINTAGWLPGSDWTGTVYEPLYYACWQNQTQSGMFFGLIVFETLMLREDKVWGFGRFEKDGVPIRSMTYFVLDNPPAME